MCSILLPVDGSDSSHRAVELVIRLHAKLAAMRVHLLHVEVPLLPRIDESIRQESSGARAEEVLTSVKAALDGASIPYTCEIVRGYVGSTIVAYAERRGCDAIVMGTRGLGLAENLLGSVARQVIHLTEIPVTLVK